MGMFRWAEILILHGLVAMYCRQHFTVSTYYFEISKTQTKGFSCTTAGAEASRCISSQYLPAPVLVPAGARL